MTVDTIKNGIVLDHITAGRGMDIYKFLGLEHLKCTVALLQNVPSRELGRKDIIKVDSELEFNIDMIGYIDPGVTVNVVKNGVITEKKHLELPKRMVNVLKCSNPRCITTVEPEIDHIFKLTDKEKGTYRCIYCESKAKKDNIFM